LRIVDFGGLLSICLFMVVKTVWAAYYDQS
jgi:hypothetical protein